MYGAGIHLHVASLQQQCHEQAQQAVLRVNPLLLPRFLSLKGLAELGYEIVSTGGSATAIEKAGVPVKRVEELTGFPEMLDGGWRHRGNNASSPPCFPLSPFPNSF